MSDRRVIGACASLHTTARQHGGRAVTRGAKTYTAFFFSHLRVNVRVKAPCRGNAAFDGRYFKRDDCALSRAQRRADSAPLQVLVPAPTRWGLTTSHRGRRTPFSYALSMKEKYRCLNELSFDGAVWTARRSAPARILVIRFLYHLASMSQLRSTVLVTPLPAAACRLDHNTYRFFGMSSKHRRTNRCRRSRAV